MFNQAFHSGDFVVSKMGEGRGMNIPLPSLLNSLKNSYRNL